MSDLAILGAFGGAAAAVLLLCAFDLGRTYERRRQREALRKAQDFQQGVWVCQDNRISSPTVQATQPVEIHDNTVHHNWAPSVTSSVHIEGCSALTGGACTCGLGSTP